LLIFAVGCTWRLLSQSQCESSTTTWLTNYNQDQMRMSRPGSSHFIIARTGRAYNARRLVSLHGKLIKQGIQNDAASQCQSSIFLLARLTNVHHQ
jgi:hypothetical protein